MTAAELVSFATRVLFVALFLAVGWRAVRQPSRAAIDTAILFGALAAAVVATTLSDLAGFEPPWLSAVVVTLINVTPWAMIRLVDDFTGTPRWVQVAGLIAFLAIAAFGLAFFTTAPVPVELATIAWFLVVGGYAAVAFGRASRRNRGITRFRMAAVAVGAYLFIATVVVIFAAAVLPGEPGFVGFVGQLGALASVIAFFVGFAAPAWIRRAWREPLLREFLERSIHLSGVPDDRRMVAALQRAAAAVLGAPGASVAMADPDGRTLTYLDADGESSTFPADAFIAGQAYVTQQRMVVADAPRADPANARAYEEAGASAVIAVPVTGGERRLGVLVVYGERAPIFADDDLWLVQLLADQTAMILDARRMAREASELRAREETTQLKEEFLSSAAHDLRTPLTVLLGQAELLERRLRLDPDARVDPAGVTRIVRESRRLSDLVSDLLDAQRLQEGGAAQRQPIDMRDIVRTVTERAAERSRAAALALELGDEPLVCSVDRVRIEQVLDNLIENALKYAPPGQAPQIRAWRDGGDVAVAVIDRGVGIPEAERALVFDRFFRGSNAQARSDTGLGLGLYICRRIVEGHGGRIWADGTPGGGSTFTFTLPIHDDRAAGL